MEVSYWALIFIPLVILHHLLNVFVQLANKRGLKKLFSIIRHKRSAHVGIHAKGTTLTSQVYCEIIKKLGIVIQDKRRGMLTSGVVILHDNASPHTAAHTQSTIGAFQLGVV
jgi:hypothetical protein